MYIDNIMNRYSKEIHDRAVPVYDKVTARTYLASVTPEHPLTIRFHGSHLTTRIVDIRNLPTSYECFIGLDERAVECADTFEDMMKNVDALLASMEAVLAYDYNDED